MDPTQMIKIVGGKRYDTETATLLAGDDYWDGSNFERHGRNSFLYRTPKGAYFTVNRSQWQGEADTLTPIDEAEARELFESLRKKRVSFEEAFPDFAVEDA